MTEARPTVRARQQTLLRFVHREILLLAVLVVVAVAVFLLTRAVSASNERLRRDDAATWFDIGRRHLRQGRTGDAIAALRRARNKDPNNTAYVRGLASALDADHQNDAARHLLVGLRDVAPDDAEVNLDLARLESRSGDLTQAVRYYQQALNAMWSADQIDARRAVRGELIRLLLAHEQRSRALSEVLVLTADLPDEAPSQRQAGELFLQAGDAKRALDRFTRALRLDARYAPAISGAAEAAFALADYARARRYLAAAPPDASRLADLRTLTDLVLANDPLAPRLKADERRRRLRTDVQQGRQRAEACGSLPPPAPQLEDDNDIEAGLEAMYHLETSTGDACGAPAPFDRALILIARLHGLDDR